MKDAKLTFIGAGNMASSIIGGLLTQGYQAANICATSPDAESLNRLKRELEIQTSTDNRAPIAAADVVVLAVKPQVMKAVCDEIRDEIQAHQPLVVSIAAGLRADTLETWLGGDVALIRCMPNTPALVQTGVSGLYANARCRPDQRQQAEAIMNAVGLTLWLDEEAQLDAVTAVSGSGPAYFFLLMEALEEAGVQQGLPRASARQLALQTALGAARMATSSDVDAAELRRRVTSPGGTTEQAINTFEHGGLRQLVQDAVDAAAKRSAELAEVLAQQ